MGQVDIDTGRKGRKGKEKKSEEKKWMVGDEGDK